MTPRPRIAVIGGGVTGLVAARTLILAGAAVTLYEAAPALGGQVHTQRVAGHPVDLGAEALPLQTPGVEALLEELDLRDHVVASRPGPTWLWPGPHPRRLPPGVGPAGPARLRPLLHARILSPRGLARAAVEPLLPATDLGDDLSVGAFMSARFGRQVTDRLVDPLLGGLHAADVDRLSLRATLPQLAELTDSHRSVVLARRRGSAGGGPPTLVGLRGGLGRLVDALAATPGLDVRRGCQVRAIHRDGAGYRLTGDAHDEADGVVIAVPAAAAHGLLRSAAPPAADLLADLRAATVTTVVLAYQRGAVEHSLRPGTGVLTASRTGRLLKSATFLSAKWPHLDVDDHVLVRLSTGRVDDDRGARMDDGELIAGLRADLADVAGVDSAPIGAEIRRWPATMPQLEVGHLGRMHTLRAELRHHLPGVEIAGAPYDGVGVARCLDAGQAAARRALAALAAREPTPPRGATP